MSEMTALQKELSERGVNEYFITRFVADGGFLVKEESGPVLLPHTIMTRMNLPWPNYDYIPPRCVAATIKKYPECINHLLPEAKKVIGKKAEEPATIYMDSKGTDFFNELEKKGIKVSGQQREQINKRLSEILSYEPRIGVFGKTGVGKSSLCNALFGQDVCPISDIEACTRNTKEVIINLGNKGIKLIDVPGVGESSERDEEYKKLYDSLLPELDLVLWVIKADDRAMASDEKFYKNIVKPHIEGGKPFFFVLNQIDKIEPFREWDEKKKEPGPTQFRNIQRKVDDLARIFDVAPSKVISVSANEKYNLIKLVDEIIRALPKEKRITTFRAVDENLQSEETKEHVKQSWWDVVIETVNNVVEVVIDKGLDILSKKLEPIFNKFFPFW